MLGDQKAAETLPDLELDRTQSPRKYSVRGLASKRLSGRLSVTPSPSTKPNSSISLNSDANDDSETPSNPRSSNHNLEHLIGQVSEWIKSERVKREGKKIKPKSTDGHVESKERSGENGQPILNRTRQGSDASETSFDLDKLEVS